MHSTNWHSHWQTTWLTQLSKRKYPALTWVNTHGYTQELTGSVIANWIYKSLGLMDELTSGTNMPLVVFTDAAQSLHWRSLSCALAAMCTGSEVHFATELALDYEHVAIGELSQVEQISKRTATAAEVFLFDPAPLALHTAVPEGYVDFIAHVRAFPDVFPLPAVTPGTIYHEARALKLTHSPLGIVDAHTADTVTWAGMPRTGEDFIAGLRALVHGNLMLGPPAA